MSEQTYKLQVQTRALQSDLKDLTRKHLEAEGKVDHLQSTIRCLKSEREKRERELSLTKQTCDRALREKNRLRDEIDLIKTEKRRLENKLHMMSDSASLSSKCRAYKEQVQELQRKLDMKEDKLYETKRALDRRSEEVDTLSRALSIKANELSLRSGSEVHSRLLYAISQGEEECVKLSGRLKEAEDECKRLRDRPREVSLWRLEEEQEKNMRLKTELNLSERSRKEMDQERSNLRVKCDSLEDNVVEQNKKLIRLQDELCLKKSELEHTHSKMHELEKARTTTSIERDQAKTDKERLKKSNLQQSRSLRKKDDQIRSLKNLLEKREKLSREHLAHERQKREDTLFKLTKEKEVSEQNASALPLLHDKARELKEANKNLRHKVDSLVKEVYIIKEEVKAKDRANDDLKKETQRLTDENEVLVNAKNLLQETMLDQIDSMRSRLRTQELEILNTKDHILNKSKPNEFSKEPCLTDILSLSSCSDIDTSNAELSI